MRRDTNIAPRCAGPAVRIGAHVVASGSRFAEEPTANSPAPAEHPAPLTGMRAPKRESLELEPLSPGRYKIVFTADADLKRKLDLARDLLRHAEPHGELAAIIGRGLDLLIERTLQRRFGKTIRRRAHSSAARDGATPHVATATAVPTAEYVDPERVASDDDVPAVSKAAPGAAPAANEPVPSAGAPIIAGIAPTPIPNDDASVTSGLAPSRETDAAQWLPSAPPTPTPAPQTHSSRHLPSATRRAVLERDGLRCTWVGPDGVRCESRAWLEHDHIVPRGLGGSDDPANIRIRCRPHNHLAAEQAYGEPAIARIIARRRAREDPGHITDANPGECEA